jgi:hypothetical protein
VAGHVDATLSGLTEQTSKDDTLERPEANAVGHSECGREPTEQLVDEADLAMKSESAERMSPRVSSPIRLAAIMGAASFAVLGGLIGWLGLGA